jgi:hypothetical protein
MRVCAVLGSAWALSGCVAAMAAPSLLVGGGSLLGIHEYSKHVMNTADRQLASADAIGQDLNMRKIKISDVKTDGGMDRWTAKTAVGRYSCSMVEGKKDATCVKADASVAAK